VRKVLNRLNLLLLVAILVASLLLVGSERTGAASPWNSGEPTISSNGTIDESTLTEIRNQKRGFTSGLECINKRIATRAFGTLSVQYKNGCWYETSVGLLLNDGNTGTYLLQPGESVAGRIGTTLPSNPILMPTRNRDVFFELKPVVSGYSLSIRHINNLAMTRTQNVTGTVTLTFNSPAVSLKNRGGTDLFVQSSYVWWQEDGSHAYIWSERGTVTKIDLQTLATQYLYIQTYVGDILTGSVALSPSGKFMAVSIERSGGNANLYLVDLEDCAPKVPITPSDTADTVCQTTSLRNQLVAEVPSFNFPLLPRFYGEHTLGFYHRPAGVSGAYTSYFLQAAGTSREDMNFLALGDSFSSGEGAFNYLAGTDESNVNMCHTSKDSYPYLVNERVNLSSFLSVACSGAVIDNYWMVVQYEDPVNNFSVRHPGKYIQKTNIENTDIATISMSGNDIGFKDKLVYCVLGASECYNSYERRMEIANEIKSQHPRLVALYENILDRSGLGRKLYVLGYPQIASADADADCGLNVQLNSYQRKMANDMIVYFNAVIKSAAIKAGALYIDVEEAFAGHKLCDGVSATMAVNGLTAGNDIGIWKLKGLANESYHPNQLGHQLFANELLAQSANFTKPMPAPNPATQLPSPNAYSFLDVASEPGGIIRKLVLNQKEDKTLIQRGKSYYLEMTLPKALLKPFTSYETWLNSQPTYLGTVTTDGAGYIRQEIQIPTTVEPGLHQLHIQGTNDNGEVVDVYEYLYVAADENDFDNDGTSNSNEPCGILPHSGTDLDRDGVDDACDALVIPTQNISAPYEDKHGLSLGVVAVTPPTTTTSTTVADAPPVGSNNASIVEVSLDNEVLGAQNNPTEKTPGVIDTSKTISANEVAASSRTSLSLLFAAITLTLIVGYSVIRYAKNAAK
jgi:hypothetical protein